MSENQVWIFSIRWTVQNLLDDTSAWRPLKENLCAVLERDCKSWVFQLEDTTQNLHFQGVINMREKIRAKTLAKQWNAEFRGIEIQPASNGGKAALQKYCMKRETRIAGPWADKPVYMGDDLPVTLWPWQEQVKNYVLGPVNPREILWLHCPGGNTGKSDFAKYMQFHHGCLKLCYGASGDLLNLVAKNAGRRAYIFDLTRCKPQLFSSQDLYSCIEDIKNGHFVNTKYETASILMSKPHIVVLANVLPDKSCLSMDRWNIQTIPRGACGPSRSHANFTFA